jgi:GT2 family glycosyltransferase
MDFRKLSPPWIEEIVRDHSQQSDGPLKAWFPPYLWHASGGTLGVKKWLHQEVGGFDETLPYQHDTDYCFKIQLKGIDLHFAHEALMHYRCRHSLTALFRQSRLWAEYSILLSKYYRAYENKKRQPWKVFTRQCKNLMLSLPQMHYKAGRAQWIWNLGWQMGRLAGSIKHRVPPVVIVFGVLAVRQLPVGA